MKLIVADEMFSPEERVERTQWGH